VKIADFISIYRKLCHRMIQHPLVYIAEGIFATTGIQIQLEGLLPKGHLKNISNFDGFLTRCFSLVEECI
jgi:hypothetical protein